MPFRRPSLLLPIAALAWLPSLTAALTAASPDPARLRVLMETDAGGDPDDEQSLVRFLLYVNEWDVEGLIVNRAEAETHQGVSANNRHFECRLLALTP